MIRDCKAAVLLLGALVLPANTTTAEPPIKMTYRDWVRPRLVGKASDSGGFSLDETKLRALFPDFDWTDDQLEYLDDHLALGDSRAALVASVKPLVVSAYSDELDAVILVQFPDQLVGQYSLDVGDHLIVSWVYPRHPRPPSDVVQGYKSLRRHNNGAPLVADFLSDSLDKIKRRKSRVSKVEWERVKNLTPPALELANGKYRSCFPLDAGRPAEDLDKSAEKK